MSVPGRLATGSRSALTCLGILVLAAGFPGCSKPQPPEARVHKHEHHPPHGGTPVVLGDEAYHLELVLDAKDGVLQVFILDGEMEDFIRSAVPAIEVDMTRDGKTTALSLVAVANPATGEAVGDTSLFEVHSDMLRGAAEFDGVVKSVTIRGSTFTGVKFNFPRGNDTDG